MSEKTTQNVYEFFIDVYKEIASTSQILEWKKQAADPLMANLRVREKQMQRMMNNLKELKKNEKSKENDFKITHQEELLEQACLECSKVIEKIRDADAKQSQETVKNE